MADLESKLRDALRAVEKVRRSLEGTQAHAADYVWSQIGKAASDLKRIERDVEEVIREVRDMPA
jgi:hypothetical protein